MKTDKKMENNINKIYPVKQSKKYEPRTLKRTRGKTMTKKTATDDPKIQKKMNIKS